MNKNDKKIISDIVHEISVIPDKYLQTLHAIIHSFRNNLPENLKKIEKNLDENSIWDELIDEINTNRRLNNIEKTNY